MTSGLDHSTPIRKELVNLHKGHVIELEQLVGEMLPAMVALRRLYLHGSYRRTVGEVSL